MAWTKSLVLHEWFSGIQQKHLHLEEASSPRVRHRKICCSAEANIRGKQ